MEKKKSTLESIYKNLKSKVQSPKSKKDNKTKTEQKKENELLKNLPKGTVVKRIEIGPRQIVKAIIWLVVIYWFLSIVRQMFLPQEIVKATLSEVVATIKAGQQKEVTVMDNEILVTLKDGDPTSQDASSRRGKVMVASKEPAVSVAEILQKEGIDLATVKLNIENRAGWKMLGDVFSLLLTVGLPIAFIIWFFGRQQGGAGGMFGFGKSTAKLFVKGKQNTKFSDVAGVEEAKKDLEEIVDFLKNPDKYHKMGARAPRGVLLVGPAGVGKTLLAKAVAGEANVPFYSMAGSEFMEMLVGVGASRVRDLFGTAKKAGKAIIFIDEIDAIGRMRGGLDGGHGEREQTLNQILVEMDGFDTNTAVVVLAATNRGDLLDPALMRPGRFDRRVVLEMPDLKARVGILKIHAKGKPWDETADWEVVAKKTVGFSGADIENMLNEAAIAAAREGKDKIGMSQIDEASLKVKLGAAKRRDQSDEDKQMTAYHEAGHAIVNFVEGLDPVSKISIISRGMALGFTLIPPSRDRVHQTKSRLISQMAMAMGGRAAEEIVFKDITTGASSDISHATNIARDMVVEWGMGDLGPVNFGPQVDIADFGKAWTEPAKISDSMQSKVDEEIKKLVNTALEKARKTLIKNRKKLDQVAKILVEKETMEEAEFEEVMRK
ncbi:ATP-dependent zinc metalloprotease FtsH [Candidatus Shapirobacteria bacterium]|nr:ATP-dependent zinc metalloprotease FtsH [Candidatus Shapirobacteria bacterium]